MKAWPQPTEAEIRDLLRRHAPALANEPIEFLGEGWSLWVYRAGEQVLRFPQRPRDVAQFARERALLPSLSAHVSLPLPVPNIYGDDGPNGAPFEGHLFIPGISLISALGPLAASARSGPPAQVLSPDFGRQLGHFLRQLHSFSLDEAR